MEALQGSASAGSEPLYSLYSSIVKDTVRLAGFWRMIAVITTAQYRPLREEPIAELAGVKPNFVENLVDDLSSLLYRGEGAKEQFVSDIFLPAIAAIIKAISRAAGYCLSPDDGETTLFQYLQARGFPTRQY